MWRLFCFLSVSVLDASRKSVRAVWIVSFFLRWEEREWVVKGSCLSVTIFTHCFFVPGGWGTEGKSAL